MQFIDLLLVRCIFGGQIGHNNYEDFEHPTRWGIMSIFPGRCPGLWKPLGFQPVLSISAVAMVSVE